MNIIPIKKIAKNLIVAKDIIVVSFKETTLTLFRSKSFRLTYIESRMLVVAHSLEKGLSMKVVKAGFGITKAYNLCYYINHYLRYFPYSISYSLIESVGILNAYKDYQDSVGFDLDDLRVKINGIMQRLNDHQKDKLQQYSYGTIHLTKAFFDKGITAEYEKIVKTRRSARSYSEKPVSVEIIQKAVELTNYAPSACNRQPSKIYVALGKENASKVGELLGNKSFTKDVNNFAVVTCDRAYFAGDEHYQWYVNGGIYLANFVLSLHTLGLGSCIMQWFAFDKNEKKLKKLLGIKKSEAIIASVSLGYYPDELTCICAQRIPVEEALTIYSSK